MPGRRLGRALMLVAHPRLAAVAVTGARRHETLQGFTAAIDQEKAMLRERLERLRAVIRRVEGIG